MSPCARNAAATCPATWCTGTSGLSCTSAMALAACSPTRSEPTRPGPCVTATASRSAKLVPDSRRADSITGTMFSTWWREAISGTTPPKGAWNATWDDTTFERIRRASATTAAAVSSQEVSIPRTRATAA